MKNPKKKSVPPKKFNVKKGETFANNLMPERWKQAMGKINKLDKKGVEQAKKEAANMISNLRKMSSEASGK